MQDINPNILPEPGTIVPAHDCVRVVVYARNKLMLTVRTTPVRDVPVAKLLHRLADVIETPGEPFDEGLDDDDERLDDDEEGDGGGDEA